MTVIRLQCPSCGAPVDAAQGRAQTCAYCHAPIVVEVPPGEMDSRDEHYVTIEVVGPSNRERIAKLLVDELGLERAAADAIVAELPSDIGAWTRNADANELRQKLEAAGAVARVQTRVVQTPRVLPRDVILEHAGPAPLQVIKAIRAHIPLGLKETKQLVESAPCEIARAVDGTRAQKLRGELIAAGATVRLV